MDIESDGSDIPHTRYEGYSLQEKFDWLRGGSGAAAAEQVRTALSRLAEAMAESDQALQAALRPLGTDWQGSAADSLGATGIEASGWVLAGGEAAQLGSTTVDIAGAGFATTRLLVERADSPAGQGNDAGVDVFLGPWGGHTDLTVTAEVERGREDAANRSLYVYEETLREAARGLPPLGPPPGLAIRVTGPDVGGPASSMLRQPGSTTEVTVDAGPSTAGVAAQTACSVDGLSELGRQTVRVTALGIEVAVDVDPQALAASEPVATGPAVAAPQQTDATTAPLVPPSSPALETAGTSAPPPAHPPAQPHTGAVGSIAPPAGGIGVVSAPGYRTDACPPVRGADGPAAREARRRTTSSTADAMNPFHGTTEASRSWAGPAIDVANESVVDATAVVRTDGATELSPTTGGWDNGGLAAVGGLPHSGGEAGGLPGRRRSQRPDDDDDRPIDVVASRFEPGLGPPIPETGVESGSAARSIDHGSGDDRSRGPAPQHADVLDRAWAPSGVHTVAPAVLGVDAPGHSA